MFAAFGKAPSGKEKQKTQESGNYRNGQFQNLLPTTTFSKGYSIPGTIFKFFNKPKSCYPPVPLPSIKTNLLNLSFEKPVVVWFGHSSYLIKIENKTILVDPVFSNHASPFKNTNKAFAGTHIYSIADCPPIDVLLITHDHYDHLDYQTVLALREKVTTVVTSLGVASHLAYWGYAEDDIHELDWHQSIQIDNLKFTALPARHFSGRTLQRDQTLWSAFALQTSTYKLLLGGDSGYSPHFKEIGEKYGPFNLAILECGQYNEAWHHIHMMPEETAQAAIDVRANVLLPVHWAKFCLSIHPWDEPVKRVTAKAKELNVKITTPLIGEPVVLDENYPDKAWWNEVKK